MIHGLHDLRDPRETLHRSMEALLLHANDACELVKVIDLRRSQWICFEERDDAVDEILWRPDIVPVEILPVVVVSHVDVHLTATEERLQLVQHVHAPLPLDHCEGGLNLPADAVGPVSEDRNAEASFTVDEADDPLLDPRPFLLIVRTRRFVTRHVPTILGGSDTTGTAGSSEFPAYSQLHSPPLPAGGAV
jgi:hypothetical protein